jgi:hypothetical protein
VLGIGIYNYNHSYKYLFPIEPTGRAVAASGDGVLLTALKPYKLDSFFYYNYEDALKQYFGQFLNESLKMPFHRL